MNRFVLVILNLVFGLPFVMAQQGEISSLQQRADAEFSKGNQISARFLYIRAFKDYAEKGQTEQGVACAVKATPIFYKERLYQEAFKLLRDVDQAIINSSAPDSRKSAMRYLTARERMNMYIQMHSSASANEQLGRMYNYSNDAADEQLKNDFLYNKVIYLYTFGEYTKGNQAFKQMTAKLIESKEYDKVNQVYQSLIDNGRKSGSADFVDQSYRNYIAWKDSVKALTVAAQVDSLEKKITEGEMTISDQQSSLTKRMALRTVFGVVIGVLVVLLILAAIWLLRSSIVIKKQKKAIKEAKDNIALKARFIGNISSQLSPTLEKLDSKIPEVKALLDFSSHAQLLSELESNPDVELEMEEVQVNDFCETLMNEIRNEVKKDVTLTVNAPKMDIPFNKEYVSKLLIHLLHNAAEYTPEEGHIRLEFKKRGAHTFQFIVVDTGCGIPEEKQDDVFLPFIDVHDLTKGDGLGLPICKQMAKLLGGDLSIDSSYTKGTRFVLDLHD